MKDIGWEEKYFVWNFVFFHSWVLNVLKCDAGAVRLFHWLMQIHTFFPTVTAFSGFEFAKSHFVFADMVRRRKSTLHSMLSWIFFDYLFSILKHFCTPQKESDACDSAKIQMFLIDCRSIFWCVVGNKLVVSRDRYKAKLNALKLCFRGFSLAPFVAAGERTEITHTVTHTPISFSKHAQRECLSVRVQSA